MVIILVVVVAGAIYAITRNEPTSNQNSNLSLNANVHLNSKGWEVFIYNGIPLELHHPSTSQVSVQSNSSSTINGVNETTFTLVLTDSQISGEMVVSNRDTGFETEQIVSENQTTINSHKVRVIISTKSDTAGTITKMKRWLFSPFNPGTKFETLWISYPAGTAEQATFFDNIVSQVKLVE